MKRHNTSNALSWGYILINLAAVFGIVYFEERNLIFLAVLIANMLWGSIWKAKLTESSLSIARVLIGLLFIYSGFVKGVDPLGTTYKIEDYFYAFDVLWAKPAANVLSVLLNAAEFSLGVMLLLNFRIRLSSALVTLMMLFFTVVTLNDAISNPVPDCGCFGDALVISNWQTFYKNLVINALLFPVFLNRKRMSKPAMPAASTIGTLVLIIGFIGFEFYNLRHLPVIDFRSWKVGNELYPRNPEPVKYFLTYKNKQSGEEKEYLSEELPWQDSVFMADWEFVDTREEDPNAGKNNLFPMMDESMQDYAKEIVSDSSLSFIMIIYDLENVSHDVMKTFDDFAEKAQAAGLSFTFITSNTPSELAKYQSAYEMGSYPQYFSDDTALKAAIRSNPGLVVIQEGVVLAKYHYRQLPSFEEVQKEFQK